MTERSGALQEDPLYMSYAEIAAKSCGEEEEEEEGGGKIVHFVDRGVIMTLIKKKFTIDYR